MRKNFYLWEGVKAHRFGFNGQEKSPEISNGNYTAEYWEYDSRIGKRWNRDPVDVEDVSPYAVFDNSPIFYNDPDGDCPRCLKALGKTLVKSIAKGKVDLGEIYDAVDAVKTLVSPTSTLVDKGLAVFDLLSPVSSKEIKAGLKVVEKAVDVLDDAKDVVKAVDKTTDVLDDAKKVVKRTGDIGVDPKRHNANVRITNTDGKTIKADRVKSGNMTPEQKKLGFPKGTNLSHTEAKAVNNPENRKLLKKGNNMTITGEKGPCNACKGEMNKASQETGATIKYQYRSDGKTKTWTAKKPKK